MKTLRILFLILTLPCFVLFSRFSSVLADDATGGAALQHVTFTIRGSLPAAFSGSLILPDQTASDISVTPTNGADGVLVSPRSVLGVLESLQASSTDFQITDLSYSNSFSSFLINCITIPVGSSAPDCFNWNDAVNGAYPQVGVEHQMLNDGDTVYLFFGSPRQTVLSKNSVVAGEPFTATAEQYDLSSGGYKPFTGVSLGVGISNPDFTFTELATSTTDTNGQAAFTLNTAGTFSVGIKEDFYFPSAGITITQSPSPPPASGGGGGGVSHTAFNISSALAFIEKNQNPNGSFDSDISTDWTALALAAAGSGDAKNKLRAYLLTAKPDLSLITDYERHALALEALGINPYSGTPINYIAAITGAFDGIQIGTASDNDDIFALIVLKNTGFTSNDQIIQKEAAYILKNQNPNGSWDETPDLTAAAIQALGPLSGAPGLNESLARATKYLLSKQQASGGFGNIDSTSWAQTAINWLVETRAPNFETQSAWTSSSGLLPRDALAEAQESDGGVTSPNRVWSTSYAALAASGKSWPTILMQFSKPDSFSGGANNAQDVLGASTTLLSLLPVVQATTTPISHEATTSPDITTIPDSADKPPIITSAVLPAAKSKTQNPKAPKYPTVKLSEAITQPKPAPADSPGKITSNTNSNKIGLLGRVWNSIVSFFRNLF